MTIRDGIKEAVQQAQTRRLTLFGRVVDCLRFKHRLDYDCTLALFRKHAGVKPSQFDEWLAELDYYGD